MVRHSHRFGIAFGFIIHAARSDGIDVTPVFLVLGRDFRIAVTFAGGSEKKFRIFRQGEAECVVRAESADLQSWNGQLEVVHRTRGRSEVQNVVHRPRHVDVVRDVRARNSELRMFQQMGDIRVCAGDQIVERQDLPSLRQQTVA